MGCGQWGHWPEPNLMLYTGDRIFLLSEIILHRTNINDTTIYVTFLAPDGRLVQEAFHVNGVCNSLEKTGYVTQSFVEPPS